MNFNNLFGGRRDFVSLPLDEPEIPATSQGNFFTKFNPFSTNKSIQLPNDIESQSIQPPPLAPSVAQEHEPITWDGMLNFSHWEKIGLFAISMAGAISCWTVSFILLPLLALKPRKFGILWSLGSILFLFSFAILQGFQTYVNHLFSVSRLWFTLSFTASIVLTLFSSLVLKSSILTIISSACQLLSCFCYFVSYFPMGKQGIRLASTVAVNQVDSWLNN